MNDLLKLKIEKLPTCPGCYLMKSEGRIIYVGKAVNLKNRVSQYFTHSKAHTVKVRAMVARIDDFDIVLCDTNLEALILECNLIKLHKPQYNILLKDDKHYPYLKIDLAQDYPRVELVRRVEKDKAKYFGPYMGATGVREVLDVLRGLFPTKNPLKRGFFWLVEPLFGGRGFITGHISPRKLAPDMPDAWTDPFTGTEHTGGVFALLPKAERRSEEFMGAALLLWLDKYTEAEFAEKIGSMSYTEGRVTPASDPANEKETTT